MLVLQHTFLVCLLLIATTFTAVAESRSPVVLFDAGHGEQFLPLKESPLTLSELGNLFVAQGFKVQTGKDPLTPAILAKVDAIVISGPFAPFSPEEIEALHSFVERGGHLAIMLHVAPIISPLLARFDVLHSNGVIHEDALAQLDGEALNFQVTHLGKDPLFSGMNHFSVYGCWALATEGDITRIAATSGDKSWVDLNGDRTYTEEDAMQALGIVALGEIGQGNFVIFGDDAIFQNRFIVGENRQLGENLVQRLKP